MLAYVDYCPAAGKYVDSIIAGLATKCLNSTRAKTKEIAADIVLMCVEIEKQDIVLEELIKALDQKTPKNVASVVRMICRCLNQFGSKVITIKPIVPVLCFFLFYRYFLFYYYYHRIYQNYSKIVIPLSVRTLNS